MLPIRNITINHSNNQIFITRCISIVNEIEKKKSIFGSEVDKNCLYPIPETINSDEVITVEDSVENGSTLFHLKKPEFPRDLELYKNQKFIFQTLNYGQIIGTFIDINNGPENKYIVLDVEEVNNICNLKPFSKGIILLNESEISSFILFDQKLNSGGPETYKSNAKLVINNTTISRDIFVTHCSKVNTECLGYYHHLIKGIEFNDLYTEPVLKPNIPIKVLTEYVWKPMFNIGDINNNTQESNVSLTIIAKDEKSIYSAENIKCLKNYETKIIINSFETTYNRAVLIHPMGPNEISIYFKNTSKSIFTKSTIKLLNSYENKLNDLVDGGEKDKKLQQIDYFNCETKSLELLNSVTPNSTGVIILKIPNEKIKINPEISHHPLIKTRSKKTNFPRIKISKEIIFIDFEFINKIKYQIINSSQIKTKLLIYCPNKELKVKGISCVEINKEVDRNLYLLESDSLSIKDLEFCYKKKEQVFAGPNFSNEISKFLKKNDFKNTTLVSGKFEIFNFTNMGKEFQKDLSKLLEKEYFEISTSSYFKKQFPNKSLEESLFDIHFYCEHSLFKFSNQPMLFFDSDASSFFKSLKFGTTIPSGGLFGSTPTPNLFQKKPESLDLTSILGKEKTGGSSPEPVGKETSNTNQPSHRNNKGGSDKKVSFATIETSLDNKSLFGNSPTHETPIKTEPSLVTKSIFGKHITSTTTPITTESSICTKSSFESSPPSLFGHSSPIKTTPSTTESSFGSPNESCFGTKPTFGSTTKSCFGTQPAFGSPNESCFGNKPIFGSTTSSIFGQTSPNTLVNVSFRGPYVSGKEEEIKKESENINESSDEDYDEDQVEYLDQIENVEEDHDEDYDEDYDEDHVEDLVQI
ncbi:hypothetical protein ACTFIZ_001520 [Dictyostelium cf. discoideum]